METTASAAEATDALQAALQMARALTQAVVDEAVRRTIEGVANERARTASAIRLLDAALDIIDRAQDDAIGREDRRRARLIRYAAHATLPPEVIAEVERDSARLRRGERFDDALAPAEFFQEVRRLAGEA